MEKIVIFGNGAYARLATHYLSECYEIVAYCATSDFLAEDSFLGKPLVRLENLLEKYPPNLYKAFVAIGYNKINTLREKFFNQMKSMGYICVSYVHSSAVITRDFEICENILILENVVVQPFCKVADNTHFLSGSVLCHDSQVGKHCFLASCVLVNGFVTLEENCFIGAGAVIRDNLVVAKKSLIGAGVVCLESTKENCVLKSQNHREIFRDSNLVDI